MRSIGMACVSCALALLGPEPVVADDFTDFRIPPNRSFLWTASLGTRAFGSDMSVSGSEGSAGQLSGNTSTIVRWFSDSDPAFTLLSLDGLAQGDRVHSTTTSQQYTPTGTFVEDREAADRLLREFWALTASQRRYPWARPIGFEGSLSLLGDYSQFWNSRDLRGLSLAYGHTDQIITLDHSQTWRYFTSVSVGASAGWGRVRNATQIYEALVLEQRLRETGALTRPLSPAARRRLAELLYARGALDAVRERPGRVLWREIGRVLSEDGALQEGGLDPYSVLRSAEPHLGSSRGLPADGVPTSPIARLTGAFVGARLADFHSYQLNRLDAGSSFEQIVDGTTLNSGTAESASRTTNSFDRVDGGVAGEFHRALSAPWQLDAYGTALLGLRRQQNHMRLDSRVSLAWLAADRWVATASAFYQWFDDDRTRGARPGDLWAWSLGASMSYYLEDHVAIQGTVAEEQYWVRGADALLLPNSPHVFSRRHSLTLGLTYRFAGWFDAPGLFSAAGTPTPR